MATVTPLESHSSKVSSQGGLGLYYEGASMAWSCEGHMGTALQGPGLARESWHVNQQECWDRNHYAGVKGGGAGAGRMDLPCISERVP